MTEPKRKPGRPATGQMNVTTIRLWPHQKEKLEQLGGVAWIRAVIDKAKLT